MKMVRNITRIESREKTEKTKTTSTPTQVYSKIHTHTDSSMVYPRTRFIACTSVVSLNIKQNIHTCMQSCVVRVRDT